MLSLSSGPMIHESGTAQYKPDHTNEYQVGPPTNPVSVQLVHGIDSSRNLSLLSLERARKSKDQRNEL